MMRCCKHCGALLEDDAKVCDFCGSAFEIPESAPQQQEQPAELPAEESTPVPKKGINKKKLFIAGGALLGVIVLVVAICFLCFGHYYAVHKYESVMNGNFRQLKTLAPAEYWEQKAKENDLSVREYIDKRIESLEKNFESNKESWQEKYGDHFYRSLEVVDSEEVTKEVLSGIKDALQETYNIKPSRVHSAHTLILKITFKGSEKSNTHATVVTAIQIDSQWYLIRYGRVDTFYNVKFITSGSSNDFLY